MNPAIELDHVLPAPLVGVVSPQSRVWNTALRLEPSRRYLVSAASGRGKSTLIALLYGLRHDYTGTLRLGGQDLRPCSADDWATHRQTCYSVVFQDLRLFLAHTAWENIRLRHELFGPADRPATERAAERLGVRPLLDKPCGQLSYGERQRVALLRALATPFQWLLLDEPFSHLDADNARRAAALIAETCQQHGAGILLTSLGNQEADYLPFDEEILL